MKQTDSSMKSEMETDSTPLSESPKHFTRQGIALETYQSTLAHLVKLASTSGWKAHAWYRAKELETHPLGIYKGISQELTQIMKEINDLQTKI
jgi:hypothetical protein